MTTSVLCHLSAEERGSNHRVYIATDHALCRKYRTYAEEDLDETRAMCNKTRMNLGTLSEMGFIVVFIWPHHPDLLFCCWKRKEVLLLVLGSGTEPEKLKN